MSGSPEENEIKSLLLSPKVLTLSTCGGEAYAQGKEQEESSFTADMELTWFGQVQGCWV